MSTHRPNRTLSLDPDLVSETVEWLGKQPGRPTLSRHVDELLAAHLDKLRREKARAKAQKEAR